MSTCQLFVVGFSKEFSFLTFHLGFLADAHRALTADGLSASVLFSKSDDGGQKSQKNDEVFYERLPMGRADVLWIGSSGRPIG